MAKPHIRRAVSVDCGWRYGHWVCGDARNSAIGGTPKEAYKRWLMQRHLGFYGGQAGKARAQYR